MPSSCREECVDRLPYRWARIGAYAFARPSLSAVHGPKRDPYRSKPSASLQAPLPGVRSELQSERCGRFPSCDVSLGFPLIGTLRGRYLLFEAASVSELRGCSLSSADFIGLPDCAARQGFHHGCEDSPSVSGGRLAAGSPPACQWKCYGVRWNVWRSVR